jgi:hypothetical protein
MGQTSVVPSISNVLWQPPSPLQVKDIASVYGRFGNIRSEYMSGIMTSYYPDSS